MRIGILGGSFNPVHNGHLRLALETLEQMGLDRVDLVPAAQPPHKSAGEIMPFDLRRDLLEAAVGEHPALSVNSLERNRAGPSYTVDTLEEYLAETPEAELFFLLGCSDFLTVPKWRSWERLFDLTSFIVVGRHGSEREELASFIQRQWPDDRHERQGDSTWIVPPASRICYLQIPRLDISGTLIRQKLRESRSLDFLVPQPVVRLLKEAAASLND